MTLQEHHKKLLCDICNISTTDFVRIVIGNARRLDAVRYLKTAKAIEEHDNMFRVTPDGITSLEQYGLVKNGQLTDLGRKYAQAQADVPIVGLTDSVKPSFKQFLLNS